MDFFYVNFVDTSLCLFTFLSLSLHPSALVFEGLLLALMAIETIDLQFVTPVLMGREKSKYTQKYTHRLRIEKFQAWCNH